MTRLAAFWLACTAIGAVHAHLDAGPEPTGAPEGEACGPEDLTHYDLGLHIGAVFIVLGASALGSLAPVALRAAGARAASAAGTGAIATAVRLGAYFGFGTLLSTALVHMLLPAAEAFASPCLPPWWAGAYEAWPYALATLAILVMQLADFLLRGYARRAAARAEAHDAHAHAHGAEAKAVALPGAAVAAHPHPHPHPSAGATGAGEADAEAGEANDGEGPCPVHGPGCHTLLKHGPAGGGGGDRLGRLVGVCLAEAGIIFHSVMIGLALGVTGGQGYPTLLAALTLHQFFEGIAIGSAAVDAELSTGKAALMAAAYSVTTPLGTAVGIGVREAFNASSTAALLSVGFLDALAAGVLLYVALAQLIHPGLTDSEWLRARGWPLQAAAHAALWAGAAVMAVIGKWA